MVRSRRSKSVSGIGAVVLLMASAALLWLVDLAGAAPLESWDDKILNANQRFKVLSEFANQAVLDRETGLVWERSPQTLPATWNRDSIGVSARSTCAIKAVGGRKGWRLPSMPELASLIDPSVAAPGPTIPPGHPFLDVESTRYWAATTDAELPAEAWGVGFTGGNVTSAEKTISARVWCVRGGMSTDAY